MKFVNDLLRSIKTLSVTFQYKAGTEQVQLITTMSRVVTIACATVLITLFYPFIAAPIRLFAVPLVLIGSWFVATHVVSNIIVSQFGSKIGTLDVIDITEEDVVEKIAFPWNGFFLNLKCPPTLVKISMFVCSVLAIAGFLFNQIR